MSEDGLWLEGSGGTGAHRAGGSSAGLTVVVEQAEIRGLPGYGAVSRALDVGCVNDIMWRPLADGSTMVSSAARIMARGDATSPLSRGLEKVLGVPLVGDAMRVGVEKASDDVHFAPTPHVSAARPPRLNSSVFYAFESL